MITYYPSRLLPFLGTAVAYLPSNLSRLYYLSWEDALWDLLPQLKVKQGSTILLPDFYCLDVIANITQHGYKVEQYPLDENFQITTKAFQSIFNRLKPQVVVIFHALGITSELMNNQSLIQAICAHSILIEDQVHRIINPQELKIHHQNHLAIDSLRKNLPLPGSFVYLDPRTASKIKKPKLSHPLYTLRVSLHYLLYQLTLNLGIITRMRSLIAYADQKIMARHDNLVGDSKLGNCGLPWIPHLHRYLNHSKISKNKLKQVILYQKLLNNGLNDSLSVPKIKMDNFSQLQSFPLLAKSTLTSTLDRVLNPLNVWSKFADSSWSKSRIVYCLPLGLHIKQSDQQEVIAALIKFCQKT